MLNSTILLAFLLQMSFLHPDNHVVITDESVFESAKTNLYVVPLDATIASLSSDDLKDIQLITTDFVDEFNRTKKSKKGKRKSKGVETRDLSEYNYQLIPYWNKKGEKEIWINALCPNSFPMWKEEVVYVLEAGHCVWRLRVNLNTRQCLAIGIDGSQ